MLLSFIIPVYNSEKYLSTCINSILDSSLSDYEIILINDGSQDDSLKICNEYAANNKCIYVVNQNNKGASSARNTGLEMSKGEYIWFVDSDDSICPEYVEKLLDFIREGYDIINFKYNRITKSSQRVCQEFPVEKKVLDGIDLIECSHSLFLWDKIFRREIIGNNRFAEGTKNIEDMYFNICVLPNAKSIVFIDYPLYNYICISTTSTSRCRTSRNLIKLSQDTLYFQRKLLDDFLNATNKRMEMMLKNILVYTLIGHIFSLMNYYSFKRVKKVIKMYREWGVYPIPYTRKTKANIFITLVNNAITLRFIHLLLVLKNRF